MRTFDAKYPQPKSKAAPIHPRSSGSLDDDEDEEDEEEYEEMLAEAAAKRDRLSGISNLYFKWLFPFVMF